MYNPYLNYQQLYQPQQNNILPPQQALKANGKASIDALQMSPNSEVLIMDTTAPIIWQCMSDSLGKVTATPWDISPHKETPPTDSLEQRVATIEAIVYAMKEKDDAKPNVGGRKSAKNAGNDIEAKSD